MNDVANGNELLYGGLTYLFINSIYFIYSLINLSASNDVSMHFQGHIEERYSSGP